MQDGLGVVWVLHVLSDAQDVSTLANVVLHVVVVALVRELRHFDFFRCELLVEVVEVERGRWQVFNVGKKNSSLQLRHRSLELGWDEGQRFMLDPQCLVQVDRLWH